MIIKSTLFFSKFIFAALILILYGCEADKNANRLNEIKEISQPLRSVDPGVEEYSDLVFLKEILERDSVQIVMIGEQTYGDGTTSLAKTRLIKFLHKQMGFDVLAFESGLYDCTRAWDSILASGDYEKHIKKVVFPFWVKTEECKPLIEYLKSTLGTDSKLELTGFDSQNTGYEHCRFLLDEFNNLSGIDLTQREKNLLVKIACLELNLMAYNDAEKYNESIKLMDNISVQFDSLIALNTSESANLGFWKNVMNGVKSSFVSSYYYKHEYKNNIDPHKINARDVQMGENLKWLKSDKYKNRKIIAWVHNVNILRDVKNSKRPEAKVDMMRHKTTMGDVVFEKFGNKMYSVIFTGFEGEYADYFTSKGVTQIPVPSDSSIEFYLRALGNNISFTNLREAESGSWLTKEFPMRPTEYEEQHNIWKNSVDGVFYIKKTLPSNYDD